MAALSGGHPFLGLESPVWKGEFFLLFLGFGWDSFVLLEQIAAQPLSESLPYFHWMNSGAIPSVAF